MNNGAATLLVGNRKDTLKVLIHLLQLFQKVQKPKTKVRFSNMLENNNEPKTVLSFGFVLVLLHM